MVVSSVAWTHYVFGWYPPVEISLISCEEQWLVGLCMFGADNCRASVVHPGTQLAIAGGLAPRSAYRSAHLAPAGVENFHYTLFKMPSKSPHSPAKFCLWKVFHSLFCLMLREGVIIFALLCFSAERVAYSVPDSSLSFALYSWSLRAWSILRSSLIMLHVALRETRRICPLLCTSHWLQFSFLSFISIAVFLEIMLSLSKAAMFFGSCLQKLPR